MILRRVIEHFRKQEWTAIALDFLIVVMGVFIANQVTTWKDDAAQAKREAAAIERLHTESEAIIDYTSVRVDMFERNNTLAADALSRLAANDWRDFDAAEAGEALGSLGLAPAATPPRSTYDELIGAGLFAEVGDAKMREAIAEYYATLSFLQGQIDYIRQGITTESAQRRFPGLKRVYDPTASRGSRLDFDFPALAADEDFMEFALGMNEMAIAQKQWWSLLLVKAKAMCAEISRFDGRPCTPETSAQGAEIFGAPDAAKDEEKSRP